MPDRSEWRRYVFLGYINIIQSHLKSVNTNTDAPSGCVTKRWVLDSRRLSESEEVFIIGERFIVRFHFVE
jgi:hypothetical protein